MLREFMEDHSQGSFYRVDEFQALASEGLVFPLQPAADPVLPWPTPPPNHQFQANNPLGNLDYSFFSSLPSSFSPPPPPLPALRGQTHASRAPPGRQFAYGACGGIGPSSTDGLELPGLCVGPSGALIQSGAAVAHPYPFGYHQAELCSKMTAQEIMDAKALAASKSHSEAERRRRERINAHLARLRSLLPSTTKTDKASLLAEVIQHVKELRRQMSEIAEESPLPTETDELTVDTDSDEEGRSVVRASLCCDDRSDLLPDVIRALKALKLRALKAEITTLGGRVKNVLLIAGEDGSHLYEQHQSIGIIQDALRAVMERSAADDTSSSSSAKRQRTNSLTTMLEHRSI